MILVTGGAGVMGSRLVRGLVEAGNPVRVLTLPNDPLVSRLDGLGVDIRYGDVSKRETLEGLLDGVRTVYHLAAVLLCIAAVSLACWLSLRFARTIGRALGPLGLNVVSRLLGLLLSAVAVEMMAAGAKQLFPALAG